MKRGRGKRLDWVAPNHPLRIDWLTTQNHVFLNDYFLMKVTWSALVFLTTGRGLRC